MITDERLAELKKEVTESTNIWFREESGSKARNDILDLITQEQQRRAMTDENIHRAIDVLDDYISQDYDSDLCDAMRVSIQALCQMQQHKEENIMDPEELNEEEQTKIAEKESESNKIQEDPNENETYELAVYKRLGLTSQKAIELVSQMQGWIPVTDENNPYPYDEEVLCLQEGGSVFSAYCELDSGHWFRGYDKMADPTHWMPLPSTPEVKGEKE